MAKRGPKPIGSRALTSTERVYRARASRPRTEVIYAAAARVLRLGVSEGWIPEHEALTRLLAELEGERVGPDKRPLTADERAQIARKALGLEGDER